MDTLPTLVDIALIWSVAAATPGPNFVLTVRTATRRSRRLGLATACGVATGTLIWGLAGFFGVSALFAAAPWLYLALKVAGGLYLIYLGIRLVIASFRPPASLNAQPASSPLPGLGAAWRSGLLTNLSNPKTAAFVASLFATTMPAEPPAALGLMAAAVMTAVSLTWYCLVAWLFASAVVTGWYAGAAAFIDRVAGAVFAVFGAKMLLDR